MDALEQQKIKVMIDMATQNFKNDIDSLKSQIKGFETEISSLRSQLMQARSQQTASVMQEPMQERAEPQRRLQPTQEREPSKEAIDRNGVAPADVSIEKMFYCGNKRF